MPRLLALAGRLAPGFTGRFIKSVFFAPARPAPGSHAKRYLATGRRFYIQVHGKKICCRQWGQGPGILFVHDKDDRTTPYADSRKIAVNSNNIVLHTTTGLGHKRILSDPGIMDLVQAYILERCDRVQNSQQAI